MKPPKPVAMPPPYPLSIEELIRGRVGAGSYTDIWGFYPPSEAMPGETVNISFYVKNLADFPIYIAGTAAFNGQQITLSPEYREVAGGQSQLFTGSFTMPSRDADVTVYAYYWTGSEWYLDDQETARISVTAASAEFRNLVITGYTSPVSQGDYCNVNCQFEHRGPAASKVLYAAIGNKRLNVFDEILHGSASAYCSQHSQWTRVYGSVNILITSSISEGVYDLYAKLNGIIPDLITDALLDVIVVEGGEPVFGNLTATYQVVG